MQTVRSVRMPLLAPAHGRLTPDVFLLGLPVSGAGNSATPFRPCVGTWRGVQGGEGCGHCYLGTSSWAGMCAHLNRPGIELEDPYQPRSPLVDAPLRLLPRRSPLLCRLLFLGMLTPLGCMTPPLRACVTHRVPHLGGKLQVSLPRRWQHPASSVTLCRARRPRPASLRFPSLVLPGGAAMWTRTIRWGSFCLHLVTPTRRRIGLPVMIPCYRV